MDFEKESFEDDNDLSRLEDDEELGGETQEMVETEEEELAIVGEESEEEAPAPRPAPAARPAPKKAAKKKTVPKKKAKATTESVFERAGDWSRLFLLWEAAISN